MQYPAFEKESERVCMWCNCSDFSSSSSYSFLSFRTIVEPHRHMTESDKATHTVRIAMDLITHFRSKFSARICRCMSMFILYIPFYNFNKNNWAKFDIVAKTSNKDSYFSSISLSTSISSH